MFNGCDAPEIKNLGISTFIIWYLFEDFQNILFFTVFTYSFKDSVSQYTYHQIHIVYIQYINDVCVCQDLFVTVLCTFLFGHNF